MPSDLRAFNTRSYRTVRSYVFRRSPVCLCSEHWLLSTGPILRCIGYWNADKGGTARLKGNQYGPGVETLSTPA